jgi:hypothetical protein
MASLQCRPRLPSFRSFRPLVEVVVCHQFLQPAVVAEEEAVVVAEEEAVVVVAEEAVEAVAVVEEEAERHP